MKEYFELAALGVEVAGVSILLVGLLVLLRTFLSFTLELEVTGRWPWQDGEETRE